MEFSAQEMRFPMHYPGGKASRKDSAVPEKIRTVLGELSFPPPPAERPYLYGCMVLSFDGKMGFPDDPEGTLISKENRFDPVGAKTDFWIMQVCRAYADGVILGAGTLRTRMRKMWCSEIADPDLIQARPALGRKGEAPLALIPSVDGLDVPVEHAIFTRSEQPVILTSAQGAERLPSRLNRPSRVLSGPTNLREGLEEVQIIAEGAQRPDTAGLLRFLRACGLEYISVEAPGYLWHLIGNGLLDEYMLNYSGVMAGGMTALGVNAGFTAGQHPHAEILSVGYHRGFLYTRQKLHYGW